jgi:hypothetical protein
MKQEIKIGDHVHVGHSVKGGAGARGIVTKIENGAVHFRSHEKEKFGYKNYKGSLNNCTLEKSCNEEVEAVEEGRGAYDELAGRMGTSSPGFNKTPAGKAREQKRRQEHLKGQMKFTQRMGGLTGPKSKLPEEVKGKQMLTFKELVEALKGKQHKLDKNKNGKLDAHDFKLLRKEEHEEGTAEGVDLEEDWDAMKRAVAARAAAGETREKSKFNKKEYSTGTVYTRKRETFSDEDDAASDKKAEKQQQAASGEAPVKRGRGRPKGSYGSYKQRSAETAAAAKAKSAASKAANKAMKKESFDDEFVTSLFNELNESEEILDFIDLLNCDEFQNLDEQSLEILALHIENALNEIKKENLESLTESEIDEMILEVLSKDAEAGDWISDFIKSDDPRFAGKSKEKRKQMALAAYYAKQRA